MFFYLTVSLVIRLQKFFDLLVLRDSELQVSELRRKMLL